MRCILAALFILIAGAQVKADSDVEHGRYNVVSSAGDIEIGITPLRSSLRQPSLENAAAQLAKGSVVLQAIFLEPINRAKKLQ